MNSANLSYTSRQAVVAFELLALPSPDSKQGLSLRAVMDAAAARLMICGLTGATTGIHYSNGEIAQWMATILSSKYPGDGTDCAWADACIVRESDTFGSAYATRGALETWGETAAALRTAASDLISRAGSFCVVEYGYCDRNGKGPALSDWTDLHSEKVLGRIANSESMATAYMIFTDQRAALKTARAEAANPTTPASIIAAAIALDPHDDEEF